MNKTNEEFLRSEILQNLLLLPVEWQTMFKRIYSHKNRDASIETCVTNMPVEKLDGALTQIENSLKKLEN